MYFQKLVTNLHTAEGMSAETAAACIRCYLLRLTLKQAQLLGHAELW